MKSDARLLLNKKKWKSRGGFKPETQVNRNFRSRSVDARKILNLKKRQQPKSPVYGSYMRTKTATAFIASQIRKEIAPVLKAPQKQVELSRDGNLIITSKSKNASQVPARKGILQRMEVDMPARSRSLQVIGMQFQPSTSQIDDLEHTALEDLLDVESLPPSIVSSQSFTKTNLSRTSLVDHILDKKNTMIADQLMQPSQTVCGKVYVSNLHHSVSQQDVMELFGDVGLIKNAEMLMPGTAIIDFFDADDAQKACDIYHNRLLDGVPMKCYLQTQKSQPRSTISQRLGNRIIPPNNPVPKLSSASITANSRSRYNPRNVQFTVKLT